MIVIPAAAYIVMVIISPVYKSNAKLWIKLNTLQQKFVFDMPVEFGKFEFIESKSAMTTLAEILKSDAVAGRIVSEMGFTDGDGKPLRRIDFVNPSIHKLLMKKRGIKISFVTDSEMFNITGYSNNVTEAKEITEKAIGYFVQAISRIYRGEVEKAIDIIETRKSDIRERLASAEMSVADFKSGSTIFNFDTQISTLITEISALESEMNSTKRSLKAVEDSRKTIQAIIDKQPEYRDAETTVAKNPLIEEYKKQLLTGETALAKLRADRTPEHPDYKAQMNQIETVKAQLAKEVERTFSSQTVQRNSYYDELVTKYTNAVVDSTRNRAIMELLEKQINERYSTIKSLSEKQRELSRLTIEVDNLKSAYATIASNLERAKSASAMDLQNAIIVQPPSLYENVKENLYFPPERKAPKIVLAGIVGMVLGLFLAFFVEYLDESLWSKDEIEKTLKLPVIGVIPKARRKRLEVSTTHSGMLDHVYDLLARLKLTTQDSLGKVISITSTQDGEGKTMIAALMAVALAHTGDKVLIIDGNLRNPSMHKLFKRSAVNGLSDYLANTSAPEATLVRTAIPDVDLITGGTVKLASPQSHLDSDSFHALVKTMAEKYKVIILDTPAAAQGSDALVISKYAQMILLIVEQGKTPRQKAIDFIHLTDRAGLQMAGVILNKVSKKSLG